MVRRKPRLLFPLISRCEDDAPDGGNLGVAARDYGPRPLLERWDERERGRAEMSLVALRQGRSWAGAYHERRGRSRQWKGGDLVRGALPPRHDHRGALT